MADGEQGGWYWMVDSAGNPLSEASKHAHGTAYVLDAGVEVYRLTGEPDALDVARGAFEWLEATVHDSTAGGYFGWTTRAGRQITDPEAAAHSERPGRDPLGHSADLKDANVHSDVLEALTLLFEVWSEPIVRERLAEVYALLTERFATPRGSMFYLVYPDFTPVPGVERYGYPFQTASRLPAAAEIIGISRMTALSATRALVDHATARAWDEVRGGMIEAGPATEPYELSGVSLRVSLRHGWVQIEALKAHLLLGMHDGPASGYIAQYERELEFVEREFLDRKFGGWYPTARSDIPGRRSLLGRVISKGNIWKDASHEADFYLTSIRMLRGLPATAPLAP
jgi:mannobiose 2-epimerase